MKLFLLFGIAVLLLVASAFANHLSNVNICDELGGTTFVSDLVTVCSGANGNTVLTILNSTDDLARTNVQPFISKGTGHDLTFLYDEPAEGEPKTVRMILTVDITAEEKEFLLGNFSLNMLAGNSLMLTLADEYYLLSYEPGQALFKTEKLTLMHIPTKTISLVHNFLGTDWFLFDILGQRQIAVGRFGDKVKITALQPGEAPAAYVTPWNLNERFEVQFTASQPAEITAPADTGIFTICQAGEQKDNPKDTSVALICRNNEVFKTLPQGQLTNLSVDGQEIGFLYEYVGNVKRISLFNLTIFDPASPSPTQTNLTYNPFISAMTEGRRVALKFQDQLYLLSHSGTTTFSLRNLVLNAYQDGGQPTAISAVGSEDNVEFLTLHGGKIVLQRYYGTPPPPFSLTAYTQEQLSPVHLEKTLSTSFSSTTRITVKEPDLETIRVAANENARYQPEFKIEYGLEVIPLTLQFRVPSPKDIGDKKALFYYQSADIQGAVPVKTAALYLLYDLTDADSNARYHGFNDQFISVFTGGKELALKFQDNYYLLGHQGNPNQVQFYDPSKLRLRSLDGTQTFPVTVNLGVASFTVPEGKIEVTVDNANNRIYFDGKTGAELLTTSTLENYFAELTTVNSVKIGASTLRLCFKDAYAHLPTAKVCDDKTSGPKVIDTQVDSVAIINVEGTNYLLEANGMTGEDKKVFIRRMVRLNSSMPFAQEDWLSFMNEVLADKGPFFNISNVSRAGLPLFYFPQAQNTLLETFALQQYLPYPPTEELEAIQARRQKTPITSNGSIVVHDRVVFLNQTETTDESKPIKLDISVRPYSYLPDNKEPVLFVGGKGSSIQFITTLTGDLFTLSIPSTADIIPQGLVKLKLEIMGKPAFLERYFAKGDVKQLTLNSVPVTITVDDVVTTTNPKTATISIKRS